MTKKLIGIVKYFQCNSIAPIPKSTESGVWSVLDGNENHFFFLFVSSILPQNVPEDVCLRYLIFSRQMSNSNLRKMHHFVKFPFFRKKNDKNWWLFAYAFHSVCQIWVMTEFETITLTQDGAVDLKTIAVFLFPKFNQQPFFSRSKSNAMSALLFAKKQIY